MRAWKSYIEIISKFGVGNDTAGPGATSVRYHRTVLGRSAELRRHELEEQAGGGAKRSLLQGAL